MCDPCYKLPDVIDHESTIVEPPVSVEWLRNWLSKLPDDGIISVITVQSTHEISFRCALRFTRKIY